MVFEYFVNENSKRRKLEIKLYLENALGWLVTPVYKNMVKIRTANKYICLIAAPGLTLGR